MKKLLFICISYMICINAAIACTPEASLTYSQNNPYSPTISFTNTSSSNSISYNWKYQDNGGNVVNFSTDENPTYTFPPEEFMPLHLPPVIFVVRMTSSSSLI